MTRSYNSLGSMKRTKQDDYTIGICPVCNRRLAAECEHRTIESEQAYAIFIAAEQMNAGKGWTLEVSDTPFEIAELGTHAIISGGEVLELDAHLDARYEELFEDMPF